MCQAPLYGVVFGISSELGHAVKAHCRVAFSLRSHSRLCFSASSALGVNLPSLLASVWLDSSTLYFAICAREELQAC